MICEIHKKWIPTKRCPYCEREEKELEWQITLAKMENARPIVIWEGK